MDEASEAAGFRKRVQRLVLRTRLLFQTQEHFGGGNR
ncbi:hypothetical protein ABH892_000277 [Paenibacillus sp. RC254]